MRDDVKIALITALVAIIVLTLFVKLAIVFNHWWIVLFSIFFIPRYSYKSTDNDEKGEPE